MAVTHFRKINQNDWKKVSVSDHNNLLATARVCEEKGDKVLEATDQMLRVNCYSEKYGLIQHLYIATEE